MNELERAALNEIMRTVQYIAEKVDEIEQALEPSSKIIDKILSTLSSDKGAIVDPNVGTLKGIDGVDINDIMSIIGTNQLSGQPIDD